MMMMKIVIIIKVKVMLVCKAKRISTLGKAQWVSSFKLSAKVI